MARSEYFNSMFSSGWSESSSTIHLPLPPATVQTVIDFLYRDESTQVGRAEDIEVVSNILVVADQLLLSRLKEQCEVQLARLLSLRNAAEILQFAFRQQTLTSMARCKISQVN